MTLFSAAEENIFSCLRDCGMLILAVDVIKDNDIFAVKSHVSTLEFVTDIDNVAYLCERTASNTAGEFVKDGSVTVVVPLLDCKRDDKKATAVLFNEGENGTSLSAARLGPQVEKLMERGSVGTRLDGFVRCRNMRTTCQIFQPRDLNSKSL